MDNREQLALDDLIEAVAKSDVQTRLRAVWELGRRGRDGDTRVIPVLLDLLVEVGTSVDEAASDALRGIGETAAEPLLALLRDRSADDHARGWAARTIAHIGDVRALEPMLAILNDRSEGSEARLMTAAYLGRLKDGRAIDSLLRVMTARDEDREMRVNAAHSLGVLGDRRAFSALVEMLGDEDVANVAAHALEEMRDPRSIDVLLPIFAGDDEGWRLRVSAIVGKVGETALPPLLAALESDDWRVRSSAARALGFAAERRGLRALIEALADENEIVRAEAASALAFIEDDEVVDPLVQALHDESVRVRLAAAQSLFHRALTGHPDQHILPVLREVAEHDDGMIQGDRVVVRVAGRTIRELTRHEEQA